MAQLPKEFTFIERGFLNCNTTIVQGKTGPVIIDSGHLSCRDETLTLIAQAGFALDSFEEIVTTHAHSDHHGANRPLKELSGAPVALSAMTASWFANAERHLAWFDQKAQDVDVVEADIVYQHGDQIKLSGMPFEVIGLPGHAPDCIGFFQPDTKVLISADALWTNDLGILHPAVHGWEVLDQAELAISRIEALEVEIAIPGHGGLVTDVAGAIKQVRRRLASFRQTPSKLAHHLTRRFLMYGILCYQPIQRATFIDQHLADGHLYEYAELLDLDHANLKESARRLVTETIDLFIARGIVQESEEGLSSSLPR